MGRKLVNAFTHEISQIKDEKLRNTTKVILSKCTDYICEASTSASGKNHPDWANGKGGLIRHTKVVCKNVETFLKMMPQYDGEDWDILYIAALLHDMAKYTTPNQQKIHMDHP